MKSTKVCTRNPYSASTRLINLGKIRRSVRIMVINRRTVAPKQGATIESILAVPRVISRGSSTIAKILYPVYPKMRSTSTKQTRPHVGHVEGIATICSNISKRRHQRAWNWLHLLQP
jgi:hypothetical protein